MLPTRYHISEKIPPEIKDSETLEIFRKKIKNWKPDRCPCRLCKTLIVNKS